MGLTFKHLTGILLSILIHELGHICMMLFFGGRIVGIHWNGLDITYPSILYAPWIALGGIGASWLMAVFTAYRWPWMAQFNLLLIICAMYDVDGGYLRC